jgi:hypothetical protein
MKKKYRMERGSRRIIIKRISDTSTQMATKIMACKLLRKCCKEEVPAGIVTYVAQCANDTMLSWAAYLRNLFLDNNKDARDLGKELHYSWLMILIELIRWKEPPYYYFCEKVGCFHATWYTSTGSTSNPKIRSGNASTFAWYFNNIHERIANTWIITQEVVEQYQGITKFMATHHNMWIQVRKDPTKERLQLWYCINEEEVEMVV